MAGAKALLTAGVQQMFRPSVQSFSHLSRPALQQKPAGLPELQLLKGPAMVPQLPKAACRRLESGHTVGQ